MENLLNLFISKAFINEQRQLQHLPVKKIATARTYLFENIHYACLKKTMLTSSQTIDEEKIFSPKAKKKNGWSVI